MEKNRVCGAAEKSEFDNLLLGNPGKADVVIDRRGFAVGFSNQHRQPLWVIYKLTAEELQTEPHKRSNRFRHDHLIRQSAYPKEYTRSGFDRGLLASAAGRYGIFKTDNAGQFSDEQYVAATSGI